MFGTRRTQEFLLVLACCFALVLIPLSAGAQNPLEKGAHGVKKGVETGAEKTKEGAEAVGHGVKKAVTGDDTSRDKSTEGEYTTQQPSKPATHPTKSTTGTMPATGEPTTGATTGTAKHGAAHAAKGGKELPSTAGELPLLALIGSLALAASGTLKLVRRKN
jgi:hypothetical protein